MPRRSKPANKSPRWPRFAALLVAGIAGLAVAALAGIAVAKSFTLSVSKNATVITMTSTKHETIASAHGRPVYELLPETRQHPLCTNLSGCWGFWPPVTVASAKVKPTAASGIKGKLNVWHHGGIFQVTLNGHPLYNFKRDTAKDVAHGDTIPGFGGTWHVILASATKHGMLTTTTSTTSTTSTNTSTSSTYTYPHY
jgi:predicted lipoprotein with Yx(FWY)xxD motif